LLQYLSDMTAENRDNRFFISRIRDLAERALRGVLSHTSFLSPEECAYAQNCLRSDYTSLRYAFYGGYPEAERKILVLFPDYMDDTGFDTHGIIKALFIQPGGYSEPGHSSYMGALLNCGVDRSCMGDIMLCEGGAVVFLTCTAADFFMSDEHPLERVGREKVTVKEADPSIVASLKREFEEISFTVASCRIDCLASEIARVSREDVKELIDRGDVRVNYETVADRSDRFRENDTVSVRGKGKYIIKELSETRKGRVRVLAYKYK